MIIFAISLISILMLVAVILAWYWHIRFKVTKLDFSIMQQSRDDYRSDLLITRQRLKALETQSKHTKQIEIDKIFDDIINGESQSVGKFEIN